jgi:putative nucleotidyltransferase with HDIG domain
VVHPHALAWHFRGLATLPALCAHDWRVARLADRIAAAAAVAPELRRAVRLGALLHDLGKCALPQDLLAKPGPLTASEWALMREHPAQGADLLARLHAPARVVDAVRHHHERWDGRGYPDGLRGEGNRLPARIIALADAYDAMTSDRPYRSALPATAARAIIAAERGAMFDPALADVLLMLLHEERP